MSISEPNVGSGMCDGGRIIKELSTMILLVVV